MAHFGLVRPGSLFEGNDIRAVLGSIVIETLTHHHLLVPRYMWSKGPASLGYASQQRNVETTGNFSQNINVYLWYDMNIIYVYHIICIYIYAQYICLYWNNIQSTTFAKCKVTLVHTSKVQNLYFSNRLRNLLKIKGTLRFIGRLPGTISSIAHLEKVLIDDYHFIGRRITVSDLIASELRWINLSKTWRYFWSCKTCRSCQYVHLLYICHLYFVYNCV